MMIMACELFRPIQRDIRQQGDEDETGVTGQDEKKR